MRTRIRDAAENFGEEFFARCAILVEQGLYPNYLTIEECREFFRRISSTKIVY